jgi:hypothetical protein
MHNVQKHNICTNVGSSQTIRSCLRIIYHHYLLSIIQWMTIRLQPQNHEWTLNPVSTEIFMALSIYLSLYSPCGLWRGFSFLINTQQVGLLGRGISPSQGHYLHREQQKHRQTSVRWVEFEPTIPMLERAKTVHALDGAATMLGYSTRWLALISHTLYKLDALMLIFIHNEFTAGRSSLHCSWRQNGRTAFTMWLVTL